MKDIFFLLKPLAAIVLMAGVPVHGIARETVEITERTERRIEGPMTVRLGNGVEIRLGRGDAGVLAYDPGANFFKVAGLSGTVTVKRLGRLGEKRWLNGGEMMFGDPRSGSLPGTVKFHLPTFLSTSPKLSEAIRKAEEAMSGAGASNTGALSGGERQRIGVASALANDPGILLEDEPNSELDPGVAQGIIDEMREQNLDLESQKTIGTPFVVTGAGSRLIADPSYNIFGPTDPASSVRFSEGILASAVDANVMAQVGEGDLLEPLDGDGQEGFDSGDDGAESNPVDGDDSVVIYTPDLPNDEKNRNPLEPLEEGFGGGDWTVQPSSEDGLLIYSITSRVTMDSDEIPSIPAVPGIDLQTGDYNGDGMVNADDYLMWQRQQGAPIGLEGDGNGDGVVDGRDFQVWQESFGSQVEPGEAGDYNRDGIVNAADYVVWRNRQGSGSNSSEEDPSADGTGDGVVDNNDFEIWKGSYGTTVEPGESGDFNGDGTVDGLDYVVWRRTTVTVDSNSGIGEDSFERGFGSTVGNALRRVLLSSIEGAGITKVRITNEALHDFSPQGDPFPLVNPNIQNPGQGFGLRVANTSSYISPAWSGFSVIGAYVKEAEGADAARRPTDTSGFSAVYENGPLYFSPDYFWNLEAVTQLDPDAAIFRFGGVRNANPPTDQTPNTPATGSGNGGGTTVAAGANPLSNFLIDATSIIGPVDVQTPGFPTINGDSNGFVRTYAAPGHLKVTGGVNDFTNAGAGYNSLLFQSTGNLDIDSATIDTTNASFLPITPTLGFQTTGGNLTVLNSAITTPNNVGLLLDNRAGTSVSVESSTLNSDRNVTIANRLNVSNQPTNGTISLKGADIDATGNVNVEAGGNLDIASNGAPTTIDGDTVITQSYGGAVTISNSTQLAALTDLYVQASGNGNVTVDNSMLQAGNELIIEAIASNNPVLSLNNATLNANVIRARALGSGAQVLVNGSNITAISQLRLYADGINSLLRFTGNTSLTSPTLNLAGQEVRIDNGVTVTTSSNPNVFTNQPNYNTGGYGSFSLPPNTQPYAGRPSF